MTRSVTLVFPAPKTVRNEGRDVGAPGPDEVFIETERTPISTGTELTLLSGEFTPGSRMDDYEYPYTPGMHRTSARCCSRTTQTPWGGPRMVNSDGLGVDKSGGRA